MSINATSGDDVRLRKPNVPLLPIFAEKGKNSVLG